MGSIEDDHAAHTSHHGQPVPSAGSLNGRHKRKSTGVRLQELTQVKKVYFGASSPSSLPPCLEMLFLSLAT